MNMGSNQCNFIAGKLKITDVTKIEGEACAK